MVKECISGRTGEGTRVSGERTKCTGEALSLGQMVANTLVNITRIEREDLESSYGLMADLTVENGNKVSRQAKVPMLCHQDRKCMENGKKVDGSGRSEEISSIDLGRF